MLNGRNQTLLTECKWKKHQWETKKPQLSCKSVYMNPGIWNPLGMCNCHRNNLIFKLLTITCIWSQNIFLKFFSWQRCHEPRVMDNEVNDPRHVWYCAQCVRRMREMVQYLLNLHLVIISYPVCTLNCTLQTTQVMFSLTVCTA